MDFVLFATRFESMGLLFIFLVIFLEYACFPIPSEIVLPLSGVICLQLGVPFLSLYLLSVLAGLCGCAVCFFIGYWGGYPLIRKLFGRSDRMMRGLTRTCNWYDKKGCYTVLIGRVIPIFRTWISFVAGLCRQHPLSFFLYSAIGIGVWNALLLGAGYYFTENYRAVAGLISRYSTWFALGLVLFFILRAFLRCLRRKRSARTL